MEWSNYAIADYPRFLGALLLYLLPGVALGIRYRAHWTSIVLAPIISVSLMTLGATALNFGLGVKVTTSSTILLALALTAICAPKKLEAYRGFVPPPKVIGIVFLLAIVPIMVQYLPHMPGADAEVVTAYPELGGRILDTLRNGDEGLPIHVDDHFHLAYVREIVDSGDVNPPHPYTNRTSETPLFSVSGLRSERGFELFTAQFAMLSDSSPVTIARFLPAIWSGYVGILLWATVYGSRGALATIPLVVIFPTTLRFLGMAYFAPSAFATAWTIGIILFLKHARGPSRLFGGLLLLTGGLFQHIVPGTLAIVAAIAFSVQSQPKRKIEDVATFLIPLVFVLPATLADAENALFASGPLALSKAFYIRNGYLIYGLGIIGFLTAWQNRLVIQRTFAILLGSTMLSQAVAFASSTQNHGLFDRTFYAYWASWIVLAALGIGTILEFSMRLIQKMPRLGQTSVGIGVSILLVLAATSPGVAAAQNETHYRIFSENDWRAARAFEAADPESEDIFLSHPWRAPLLVAVTGALPWTVLYPGNPPVRGADWQFYIESDGADDSWLGERNITWVISTIAPNAPHAKVGYNTYQILNETRDAN